METAYNLNSLMETVADMCPKLETLHLMCIYPQYLVAEPNNKRGEEHRVKHNTLHPLTRFLILKEFKLAWPYPTDISNKEFILLVENMPSLTSIHLSNYPLVRRSKTKLSLKLLPQLAQRCPNLQELGLYINCTILPSKPQSNLTLVAFTALRLLDLGFSPVSWEVDQLAFYLSKFIPYTCDFSSTTPYWTRTEGDFRSHSQSWSRTWLGNRRSIGRLVPLLVKARGEECQACLARENEAVKESDELIENKKRKLK